MITTYLRKLARHTQFHIQIASKQHVSNQTGNKQQSYLISNVSIIQHHLDCPLSHCFMVYNGIHRLDHCVPQCSKCRLWSDYSIDDAWSHSRNKY